MKKLYLFLAIMVSVSAVHAQIQFFDPPVLEETLPMNDSVTLFTILHNYTNDTLEFSFPAYTLREEGGPDDFGYTWMDSDEPEGPDWAWTEISETGTQVEGLTDDNMVGPFPMGFEFPFYGQEKNQFWISANGCICFNSSYLTFANNPIPTQNNYVDFIAWFWDDLKVDSGFSSIYYKTMEEQTIVQFNKLTHFPGTEEWITAQVVMRANGTILIRYKQVREAFPVNSATIGIQSDDPGLGLQVVYNENYIHSELAIRFDLNRNFITTVTPAAGFLPPGTQEHIWITYSSYGFEAGSYEQDLLCLTSHPEFPEIYHHNVMHVTNPNQAGFKGYVTDAVTGFAINDVQVKVGEQSTYTNNNGYYELPLEEGVYTVKFIRNGYQTLMVPDTTALPGFSVLDAELSGFYFIAGQVFAGQNIEPSGFAYGYKMLEGTVVDIFAEMTGEMGWYEFSGLSAADYIIKAEPSPNSANYGLYLPTYYGDVLHWEDAEVITLTAGTDDAHINLIPATSAPQGPGSVSGIIHSAAGRTFAANVPVILKGIGAEHAYMTYSAIDGSYSFSGLSLGNYSIFAEIPGKNTTPRELSLTEGSPVISGVEMMITGNQIIFLDSKVPEFFQAPPSVYPVPFRDKFNLALTVKRPVNLSVSLINASGAPVFRRNIQASSAESLVIPADQLSAGIYLLTITSEGKSWTQKIEKK
jgi:hypothetical protein